MKSYIVSEEIITSEVESEMIILFNQSKKILILNETSSVIFKLIDLGLNDLEIIECLKLQYDANEDNLLESITDTINLFLKKGIIIKNADT